MDEQLLSIALQGPPSADESDYVLIEQQPWAKDVGRTSKRQGILGIGAIVFGGRIPQPNCGGIGGFDTPVYVYPSRVGLQFIFRVSHGEYQTATVETVVREEILKCGLQDKTTCDYPVLAMQSILWLGKCYDAKGNVVARPMVTRQGRDHHFSQKVFGSLRIKYLVLRKTYNVRIEERGDSIENNFQALAYCVGNGWGKWKEIEAPSGYEDTLGNCGNGLYGNNGVNTDGTAICSPDWGKGTYPTAVKADRKTDVDYCSQQISSDRITESVETENEPGEECSDGPIVTN